MIQGIIHKVVRKIGKRKGISSYYASYYLPLIYLDYKKASFQELRKVRWAHRRGFFYEKVCLYGLNEENYKKFLCDFDYYKLHPINGCFSLWIDDKLTIKYLLSPFKEYLPEYYYQITMGKKLIALQDAPERSNPLSISYGAILNLLRDKGRLILKKRIGSVSEGIYLLKYVEGVYIANDNKVTETQLIKLLAGLKDYIIQEYIYNSNELPRNFDALRIVIINDNGTTPNIVSAYMNIDLEEAVENNLPYFPELLVKVNVATGEYSEPRIVNFYKSFSAYHTKGFINTKESTKAKGIDLHGVIPHWQEIRSKLKEMFMYLPQLSYVGVDLIVTESSFKLLEINSHQDPICQVYAPFLEEGTSSKKFFNHLLNKTN